MTGMTDIAARAALETFIANYPYIGLFTAVGSDDGTGFTEVSGGSYARFATGSGDWSAAAGSAPSYIQNVNQFNLVTPTGSWGTVIGLGHFDAPTSGNLGGWDYLGTGVWMPCTVSNASPGVITTGTAHGFSVGDIVEFTTEYGGTAPSFSQSNFTGQLILAHAATSTFDVTNSATQVNTSSAGNGMVRKLVSQTINSGGIPFFAASSLVVRLG